MVFGILHAPTRDGSGGEEEDAMRRRFSRSPDPVLTDDDKETRKRRKGFNLGGFIGGIGKFLAENPFQASYTPGSEGARGTTGGTFGVDTTPLHTSKLIREGELEASGYQPGKGVVYKRPEGKKAGGTWSFNKENNYAHETLARGRALLSRDPKRAKSPEAMEAILSDPSLSWQAKGHIIKEMTGKDIIGQLMQAGIIGS